MLKSSILKSSNKGRSQQFGASSTLKAPGRSQQFGATSVSNLSTISSSAFSLSIKGGTKQTLGRSMQSDLHPKISAHKKAAHGDVDIYRLMLDTNETKCRQADPLGNTALTYAAHEGQFEMVALIVKEDATVIHMQNLDGNTALHYACQVGASNSQVITFLVESGADIFVKNFFGESPQDIVRSQGNFSAIINNLFQITGAKSIQNDFLALMFSHIQKPDPAEARMILSKDSIDDGYNTLQHEMLFEDVKEIFNMLTKTPESGPSSSLGALFHSSNLLENMSSKQKYLHRTTFMQVADKKPEKNLLTAEHIAPIFNEFMGMNLNDRELEEVLEQLDLDGSGDVDERDFCYKILKPSSGYDGVCSKKLPFQHFDKDGDGIISTDDLLNCKAELGLLGKFCPDNLAEAALVIERARTQANTLDSSHKKGMTLDVFEEIFPDALV